MQVRVQEIAGTNAITLHAGERVYNTLLPLIEHHENVTLDFSGVNLVASTFLNVAVGRLYEKFTPAALNETLRITNLNPPAMSVLQKVIANSREYYTNPDYRKRISGE